MTRTIPGLHHVTAISGPPQANVDFFAGVLGQRLVKKTVNFDAPDTYHLYYGDAAGNPGTILTFFPVVDAGPGQVGPGMAQAYAYAVPAGGLDRWARHAADRGVATEGPAERFGDRVLTLRDPDGAPVELVEAAAATDGEDAALAGFHSVTLWQDDIAPTHQLLTGLFGYEEAGHETANGTERLRLRAPGGATGAIVDLVRSDARATGRPGTGTIHHVAFRAETDALQEEWREALAADGHRVTPVIDRQYFNAIYFREPGGVLFEIATDPPGFAADEDPAHLGEALKLPAQHEHLRARLEASLPPITMPA